MLFRLQDLVPGYGLQTYDKKYVEQAIKHNVKMVQTSKLKSEFVSGFQCGCKV